MSTHNLLSGFQDFLPESMLARNNLVSVVRGCYEKFGFLPQDTPCLERTELLTGKYGDNEKMIYSFEDHGGRRVSLRYDLTVPLTRFINMYINNIVFPYRRYQVGLSWRADKPGKGRFREFMQMDADIIGDESVLADVEVLTLMASAMEALGVRSTIRFNCRQILDSLVEMCQLDSETSVSLMRSIDKFDKIGQAGVLAELAGIGFSPGIIDKVGDYLEITGTNAEVLQGLTRLLGEAGAFQTGIALLSSITDLLAVQSHSLVDFEIDPTIARGLDYYTGLIFETRFVENPEFGSVCSGGRYDRLLKRPNGEFLPAVGLSIGIDRLLAAMKSVGKAPVFKTTTQVFIANFDEKLSSEYLKLAGELRQAGVAVEIFSKQSKIAKQLDIANKKYIPLVVLVGPDEISLSQVLLKDMRAGVQITVQRDQFVPAVLERLGLNNHPLAV